MIRRAISTLLIAAAGGLALSACYVDDPPPVAYAENNTVAYEPQYYDGYVVYYDQVGRPYHYNNGEVVWIRPEWPGYSGYVHYWRGHNVAYRGWYDRHGVRYRAYRRGDVRRR